MLAFFVRSATSSQPAAAIFSPPTPTSRMSSRRRRIARIRFDACSSPLSSAAEMNMVAGRFGMYQFPTA